MTIGDREIWTVAGLYMKRHSTDAKLEAGRRADELLAEGDLEGQRSGSESATRLRDCSGGIGATVRR